MNCCNITKLIDNFPSDELFESTLPVRELETTYPEKAFQNGLPQWRRLQDGLPPWWRFQDGLSGGEQSFPRSPHWDTEAYVGGHADCLRWMFFQRKPVTKWYTTSRPRVFKEDGEVIHIWIAISAGDEWDQVVNILVCLRHVCRLSKLTAGW